MNLLVDESVPRQIVDRLRHDGHHVTYVADSEPGISDDSVLDIANRDGAVLITADLDFGELVVRQQRPVPGVVLIRLAGLSMTSRAELVAHAINNHGSELSGAIAVITPSGLRIRPWRT